MKKSIIMGLCLLMSIGNVKSQVTIGSATPPVAGALLDLKDGTPDPFSIGITASKGLGLPRVALQSNSGDLGKSLNAAVTTNGTLDKDAHIGLLVYNTNPIETSAAARLCPGLHVWDGDNWNPIVPYPTWKSEQSLAGPTDNLIDARDGETYHTARFHTVVVTGNPYACDASNALTSTTYDAGIWMTQNLRTKLTPNGTVIPLDNNAGSSHGYDFAIYAYPRPEGEPNTTTPPTTWTTEQGLLYNWAAATVGPDGQHGKGGIDGEQNTGDEGGDNEGARIQGICPTGWHLPSDKEYAELEAAMTADPTLYTTAGSGITASQPAYIWMDKESIKDNSDTGGRSKPSDAGGFSGLLVGNDNRGGANKFGVNGFFWSSSGYGLYDAWSYVFIASYSNLFRTSVYRFHSFSVRCKKD